MAWSEIKKAVNSDISTPLNTLFTNLISQVKSYISTAGNVKVVRNVQRGVASVAGRPLDYGYADYTSINLSGFTDTSKMQVILNGGVNTQFASQNDSAVQSVLVTSLSTNSLVLAKSSGYSDASSRSIQVSYEVIEFY